MFAGESENPRLQNGARSMLEVMPVLKTSGSEFVNLREPGAGILASFSAGPAFSSFGNG